MGEARNRGTYEERVERAAANHRAEQRMKACNERMAARIRRDEELARHVADRRVVIVGDSPRQRMATRGLSTRGMLVAALALAALPGVYSAPIARDDAFEKFRDKFGPPK